MIEFALIFNLIAYSVVVAVLYWRGYVNFHSGLFIYLAFHFITFVERPIAVYLFDLRSEFIFMGYMPTEAVFVQTILVTNVGLLSFIFGYLLVLRFQPIVPSFY